MRTNRGLVRAAAVLTAAFVVAGGVAGCAAGTGTRSDAACARNRTPTGISAGTTPPATPSLPPSALPRADAARLAIGVALDGGPLDAAVGAGLGRAAVDLGLPAGSTTKVTGSAADTDATRTTRLARLVTEGHDPVIAVGAAYAGAVQAVAAAHPDVRFAIVDDDSVILPNVTALVFAEEQASFLVGAAAALKTMTCRIGFVGGAETPLEQKSEAGYVQGARAVAPGIRVDVGYVGRSGGPAAAAVAADMAHRQFGGGADIVYAAAGDASRGVFQAARATGDLAIGAVSDQYAAAGSAAFRSAILTSALEHADVAVRDYVEAVASGDVAGLPTRFGVEEGGVGYATSGGRIDDIVPDLQAYETAIVRGTVKVSTTPAS